MQHVGKSCGLVITLTVRLATSGDFSGCPSDLPCAQHVPSMHDMFHSMHSMFHGMHNMFHSMHNIFHSMHNMFCIVTGSPILSPAVCYFQRGWISCMPSTSGPPNHSPPVGGAVPPLQSCWLAGSVQRAGSESAL